NRYCELTTPLIGPSAVWLIGVLENGGRAAPQPHYRSCWRQREDRLSAVSRDYLELQLAAQLRAARYGDFVRRVPTSAGPTSSTSKSLRHARQLGPAVHGRPARRASRVSPSVRASSGVQFRDVNGQAADPRCVQIDELRKGGRLHKAATAKVSTAVVVEAYEKAIELLSAKKAEKLSGPGLQGAGLPAAAPGAAQRRLFYWSECLDCLLGAGGVWGCILGGHRAASNIAQYIMSSDLGLRLDCCFLAARLLQGPVPQLAAAPAVRQRIRHCEVTNLMPGVSLLGNRFRADVRVWEAALSFVIRGAVESRAQYGCAAAAQPSTCLGHRSRRDLHRSVKGRIKRLEVLTSLSLYSEACATLKQLLKFRTTETKRRTKSLLCEENLHAVDKLSHRRLTPALAALYGHNLVCKVTVAQASLLCSIASTVQALPEKISFDTAVELDPALLLSPERGRRGGGGGAGGGGAKRSMAGKFQTEDLKQPKSPIGLAQLALQQQSRQLTPEILKFLLLRASGDSLQAILDSLLPARDDDDQVSAALNATELELAVNCLLGLSRAARERHHARTAARFAQRALRLLAMSDLLSPTAKSSDPSDQPQLAQQSSQSPSKSSSQAADSPARRSSRTSPAAPDWTLELG
uniref:Protein kinase domain-containing protein n=1 Tax=Macrostomum lignano TaxID=282301 RepID=A0A1I8FSP1_9PLAT